MRCVSLVAMAVFVVIWAGCDLLGPDGRLYAGVVVDAETGLPIEGIDVSFQTSGGFAIYTAVASTLTDATGRFRLRSDRGALFVNSPGCYGAVPCPFNPAYSGGNVTLGTRDRTDLRFDLRRLDGRR